MSSQRTAALFQSAMSAHKAGRHAEADLGYQRVLASDPNHVGALNLRGLALFQQGRFSQAEALIRRALALAEQPNARHTLGLVLEGQGKPAEAEAAYRRAVELAPDYADAHNRLGNLLRDAGRLADAELAFRRELALRPDPADVHYNLGIVLQESGRPAEAEAAYRQALAIDPGHADAHHNLGVLFRAMMRLPEAEAAYRHALSLRPEHADACNNLATLLMATGRHAEAEAVYRRALACRPDFAEVHNNLGKLFEETKRLPEAEAAYRRALDLKPGYGNPLGQIPHVKRQMASWSGLALDDQAVLRSLAEPVPTDLAPFALLAMSEASPDDQRTAGKRYAEYRWSAALNSPAMANSANGGERRLRIGYLSADFRDHPVAHLLVAVLESHRRESLAVHLYAYGPNSDDAVRRRARAAAESYHDIAMLSDLAAARRIAEDGIDILIDLTGYTAHARLGITALRPAPVIVAWLGYPASLGHPCLADYLIGDPVLTPLADAANYSETLALMPHCYQPNDRARPVGRTPARRAAGLPETGLVFCCFNQTFKLDAAMFGLWCRLLAAVPGSVLWLSRPGNEIAIDNLRHEAIGHGIDPDRLVFAGRVPTLADHLGRLRLADLALDTFPYTSHTTGSDALWAGVPLVTKMGASLASRVAASLVHAVGLPELVTHSDEAYFALARDLALDPARLGDIRRRLEDLRLTSPLFDTARFSRDLERLYREIRAQYEQGVRAPISLMPE